MHIAIITLFPDMFQALETGGVIARALTESIISLSFYNPRDYATDTYRTVDDRPFGGGPGMVMKAEPIALAIEAAKSQLGTDTPVYYLSPQGTPLSHQLAQNLSTQPHCILLCGRYEGIDERVITTHVDAQISIGDYVLSGGELPAMVLIDTITRLLPGTLGHADSAQADSFATNCLDHPHYTRPETWRDTPVPEVLRSGDHQAIETWRAEQAQAATKAKRPDLLKSNTKTASKP